MRVIPVIDLKGAAAVHAVRGERERYRPLHSEIAGGSDPVEVTRAVRDTLELDELYVADLDAIAGRAMHRETIAALAREARVMVDAGVTDVEEVGRLLELGAARVVIGTETLADERALERLRAALLDLARVGSGAGPDLALVRELNARFPELELLAGGGVRDVVDVRALADAGAAGALVATALHSGAIGRDDLRALR
jgi:uncharacterized protein related to proFAR isomerase